jgi:hypothetical protein
VAEVVAVVALLRLRLQAWALLLEKSFWTALALDPAVEVEATVVDIARILTTVAVPPLDVVRVVTVIVEARVYRIMHEKVWPLLELEKPLRPLEIVDMGM